MKRMSLPSTFLLILSFSAVSWSVDDSTLQNQVEQFYKTLSQMMENKDLEGCVNLFSDDFSSVMMGVNKNVVKQQFQTIFNNYDQVRQTTAVEKIVPLGDLYQVWNQTKMEATSKDSSKWTTISDSAYVEYLVKSGDSFKIRVSTNYDKERMANVNGLTYQDNKVGYSFSVPEGWVLLPFNSPNMMGCVLMLAPDVSSAAMFGMVEVPYNIGAKEAVEGDDNAAKKLSPNNFELISAGETKVNDLPAYESRTRFQLVIGEYSDKERERWRVYFSTGGLLYTFNCDAIPPSQWENYKDEFESILKSFSITNEAKENSAQKLREQRATGQVSGRIYTNDELGCQIAAPEGWTLDPGTISEQFKVALTIKPPKGTSIARLLAIDIKDQVALLGDNPLDKLAKQQMESIKMVAKEATNEEVKDVQVGNLKGKTFVQQFTIEGVGTMKRKNAFFLEKGMFYMILCDAFPETEYPQLEPQFDQIIQLFTVN